MDQTRIRNFCIIAHIDHGKSTLADRMLELTGTVSKREMQAQLLDSMELEREKGITIKLQPVQMTWRPFTARTAASAAPDTSHGSHSTAPSAASQSPGIASPQAAANAMECQLNLIDTPGHVDFSYEVSRSLAACEGAILVVDAAQGIQAQTLANVYLAIEAGLEIIPVLNKIDLPAAEPDRVAGEVAHLLGCKPEDVLRISAKEGTNVDRLLDQIVEQVPPPKGDPNKPLRGLIFDSVYDEYRGVILFLRIVDGSLSKGDNLKLMSSGHTGLAVESGIFKPKQTPADTLATAQIGYVVTNLKSIVEARVGDTVTLEREQASEPLPGYRQVKPFVFAGFFTSSAEQYPDLKDALEKLKLNDAALAYTPENSQILGFGFRVGFLGLLHMEIIKERLEREYGLDMVVTSPSTDYVVKGTDGTEVTIRSAGELPEASRIESISEPWMKGEIVVPGDYVGPVIQLINKVRGVQKHLNYIDEQLALINFEAPLANVLTNFYDQLKSLTSGYGSFNYELGDYKTEKLVRLDILVGGQMVDSLSMVVHRDEAYGRGKAVVEKLKEVIPRQLFEVSLQAAIGGKIIAREDVKAMGKNVTAKLYGGDITRKRKLIEKQKAGKKRMKKIGKVDIPAEAFMVLVSE
ncbi:MAG TPA: translation elongation factor 4 [Candidatus Saccharimonadales bacterium]|nr:translation elongation factor 4 [Candidatus Saccharimonadales bacterium]